MLTPFPGTPLHSACSNEGRILTRDWELYDGQHVVFQPLQMTPEALRPATSGPGRRSIGCRPIVRRLVEGARAQMPLAIAANLGYRFYAHNLHRFYTCDWHLSPVACRWRR